MQRLEEKLTKENLWIYVLSILKERPAYPYEISELIEKRFGWKPARVTAYMVMRSLRSKGYVKVSVRRGEDTGKMRNYYEITESGVKLLEKGLQFLERTLESLKGEGKG
ncbi:MAG: PadR family transcriptional regulator [Candidatus Korarchaeota archaeon NZ13-K]|nr:MAG: PadR family transcriptional regulator [Candidatus Korarchaeota archaeon NZ13-K]